jgi:hypothetical protein
MARIRIRNLLSRYFYYSGFATLAAGVIPVKVNGTM